MVDISRELSVGYQRFEALYLSLHLFCLLTLVQGVENLLHFVLIRAVSFKKKILEMLY